MNVRIQELSHDFNMCEVVGGTVRQRVDLAMTWLLMWLGFQASIGRMGAVVFDIDDTLVDDREQKLLSVCKLYARCQRMGFVCAIVTARPDGAQNRAETERMLRAHGIHGWMSLQMMPSSYKIDREGISKYKRDARNAVRRHHDIIANIGDQWTDLITYPLVEELHALRRQPVEMCAILFPPRSDGEVAIKLVGRD